MKRIFFIISVCLLGFATGGSADKDGSPSTNAQDSPLVRSPDKGDSHRSDSHLYLVESLKSSAIVEEVHGEIPRVIILQDIHAQPDAQLKIEQILTALEKNFGPLTVLLEGGTGPADGTFFKSFPIPEISRSVLLEYLKRGELSGAELAAATHPTPSSYEGMEDWSLYEKNREAMRQGNAALQKNMKWMQALDGEIAGLKERYFSAELMTFENQKKAYHAGKKDMFDYVNYLISTLTLTEDAMFRGNAEVSAPRPALSHSSLPAGRQGRGEMSSSRMRGSDSRIRGNDSTNRTPSASISHSEGQHPEESKGEILRPSAKQPFRVGTQDDKKTAQETWSYPILHQLAKLKADWTPELDKNAESEKFALIKELESFYGTKPQDTSDAALVAGAVYAKVPIKKFEDLEKRSELKKQVEAIKELGFAEELNQLEREVPSILIQNDKEKRLFQLDEQFQMLGKLTRFELSRNEYLALKKEMDPLSLENFINSLKTDFPMDEIASPKARNDMIRAGEDLSSPRRRGSDSRIRGNDRIMQGNDSEMDLKPFVDFYELAIQREQAFLQKIHTSLERKRPVVIVVGGFHSQGIKDALRDPKISFISLMPKTEHLESNERYLDLMLHGNYSYLASFKTGPAGALALATVLTYVSNPENFGQFVGKAGEDIYDALAFEELETEPYDVLSRWAGSAAGSGGDPVLLKQYQDIITRLYLNTMKPHPAAPGGEMSPEAMQAIRRVNLIFGQLFLVNGRDRLEADRLSRFLKELETAARRPRFDLKDVILLVYGAKWGLPYDEMVSRYRKFLRFEELPPDIPPREYHLMNEVVFYYAVSTADIWADVLDQPQVDTLRDFLNENPLDDLSGHPAAFAIHARLFPYGVDTRIETIKRDAEINAPLTRGDFLVNKYPGVPKKDLFILPDRRPGTKEKTFKIVRDRNFPPGLQKAYDLVELEVKTLERELETKYRRLLLDDPSLETFSVNLSRLDTQSEGDREILGQIREAVGKVLAIEKFGAVIEEKKKELARMVRALQERPSSQTLAQFRKIRAEVMQYHLDEIALATGSRRPDILGKMPSWKKESKEEIRILRELSQDEQGAFKKIIDTLLPLARALKEEPDPARIREILTDWQKKPPNNTSALWQFLRSQNFDLDFTLEILSDQNFKYRKTPPTAIVSRGVEYSHYPFRKFDLPGVASKDYEVSVVTGHDQVYFVQEFLEQLSRYLEADPERGEEVVRQVIGGLLREELEGHKFPLGSFDLFFHHEDEVRERLDTIFQARGFDRKAIEAELRLSSVYRYLPGEKIDNEEAVAKFMRGGGSTEKLVQHLASEAFITFGFERDFSTEYFRGLIRDHFVEYYEEFPWIHLKLLPEETQGSLSPYQGQTFLQAVEDGAVKLFERWQRIQGRSLGSEAERFDLNRLLAADAPSFGDLSIVYDAVRNSLLNPEAARWQMNLERLSQESFALKKFVGAHPDLDEKVLEGIPFGRLFEGKAVRPSAVHFLPQAAPESEEELLALTKVTDEKQRVYLYSLVRDIGTKGNLGEMIGKLKSNNVGNGPVRDALQRFEAVRVPKRTDLEKILVQELKQGAQKGWGASIFTDRAADPQGLPSEAKGSYVILHTDRELAGFSWLNEKIKKIGFLLPAMNPEEAKQLRLDLAGYGFEFKETEKGLLVWIEDIEKLLTRIGQEYQAALLQAKAA